MEFELPMIELTENLSEMSLPLPEQYDYWASRKDRIFYIDYEIDDDYGLINLSKVIFQMNVREKDIPVEELKPIIIMIHSFGGDSFQSNYFSDLLISSRIPIYTVGMGTAMSAGFNILLAGHKRFIFEHTQVMVHKGYSGFEGTASEFQEFQKNYAKQLKEMEDYILKRTDMDSETFREHSEKDWYLTKEEIEKFNIAKIIKNIEEIWK